MGTPQEVSEIGNIMFGKRTLKKLSSEGLWICGICRMRELNKHNVLVLGCGNIGAIVANLLADTTRYQITLVDILFNDKLVSELGLHSKTKLIQQDVSKKAALVEVVEQTKFDAVISCLPYFLNPIVAEVAKEFDLHYFDVTEDIFVTESVKAISKNATKAFVPQCGLAPGFINIVANSMTLGFDKIDTMKLRVGALPSAPNNALKYALTWSTDGVINEYCNQCPAIINGKIEQLQPLEGLESIYLDGTLYECFNTSGGLGAMIETYYGKVNNLTYKTIRYPTHCQMMNFLVNDLKLNARRDILKNILEQAIPQTRQDVVLIYASVAGIRNNQYVEEQYSKRIYNQNVDKTHYTAIQITTASGLCAIVDKVLTSPQNYQGFIKQESFTLDDVLSSRFGVCYQ
jgi:saccharopine dehydrogenase-like NADP-dependent oxidoreductase